MFKILKTVKKPTLDDSLDLSTFKSSSNLKTDTYKSFFIFSSLDKKFLNKKRFKIDRKESKIKNISNTKNIYGYWDKNEHNKFIEALYMYNCDWDKIKNYIGNRTYYQIVSHSQKFFLRLKKFKDAELGLDFTSIYVNSLDIIVDMVKEKEVNLNINKRLLQIISEKISFGKNIKRKEEEELLLSNATQNNFDLFNSPYNDNNFSCNFHQHNSEDYNDEVEENKDGDNYSSKFDLSPTDGDIEKEADEISLLNINNRKNIIFLQL